MGTKDVVISEWLSDKVRFADLFNDTVFDGRQVIRPEELEIIKGESDIIFRNKNKRTVTMKRFRDVVMRWNNKIDFMVLAGEAQSYVSYIMPVRNMLYDGVAYTDHLCPVITLVFYFGEEPWDASLDLYGMFPDTYTDEQMEMLHKYVPNYRVNLIDINRIEDCEKFVSDLRIVLELMSFHNDKEKVRSYMEENRDYFSNMDIVSSEAVGIFLGCHRQVHKMIEEGGEVDMCKALDDLYNDGIEQGMQIYDALIEALANAGRIQEIVRCTSDKEYKKKLLSEFNLS